MKKGFKAGLCAGLLVAPLFATFANSVYADDSYTNTAKVGSVDEVIYSVDVAWGLMTFDWRYNDETEEFEFRNTYCLGAQAKEGAFGKSWLEDQRDYSHNLYFDNNCSNRVSEDTELVTNEYYYYLDGPTGWVDVTDNSVRGKVKAQAQFTPAQDYNWVIGKFARSHYGPLYNPQFKNTSTPAGFENNEITNGYLDEQDINGNRTLRGILYLEVNPDVARNNVVSTNDTIGTVTITISPDEN